MASLVPENNQDELEELPDEEEILRVARERLSQAQEAWNSNYRDAEDDLKFIKGEQWPEEIKKDRSRERRPCLVINRLPQFIQNITNDQRQNRPAIKVHPVADGAGEEVAKVIQGLIRHIEYNSNAETAYDTAFESSVSGGFGFFRIITDFSDPESFDQEIFIKRIRNPFSVFFDPYSQEPDGSDAQWAFIVDDISKDEYKAKYPNSKLAAPEMDWSAVGNDQPGWIKSGESARIAEYFYIENKIERIHLLKTGMVVRDHELFGSQMRAQAAGIDASVEASRMAKIPVVKWVKINGVEILEQTEWPGSYIPIIPVFGAEIYINGVRTLLSLIRNAKDAQRMYNYWKSAETETIALAPKAPFVAAEGQLEGYEKDWAEANTKNHAFLYYKPTTIAGQPAPPPQRQAIEPATQAITQAAMLAADDLKATTGVYDAALGQQSPDSSGIAIARRTNQTQTSNFHFVDNLHRSIKHAGRILVDLIPHIYDAARTARIIHEDGTQKMVRVNESFQDENGKDQIYSLDVGKYDVTIDTGPSYASKRQEAAAAMTEVTRVYPQLMQVAGDLMIKSMDWPGAQEMADRIKLTLPPALQNDAKAKQIPPQVQAQMAQMDVMIKQLSEHLNEKNQIIETKQLELSSRERIEMAKIQADIEINLAKLGTQSGIALLQQEIGAINHRLKLLGIDQPIDAQSNSNPQPPNGGDPSVGGGQMGPQPTGGQPPGIPMEQ